MTDRQSLQEAKIGGLVYTLWRQERARGVLPRLTLYFLKNTNFVIMFKIISYFQIYFIDSLVCFNRKLYPELDWTTS